MVRLRGHCWGPGLGKGRLGQDRRRKQGVWRAEGGGHRHLPTSTRVASESGGIFSKIPDGERPSVPPSPCGKAGGKGSIRPPPSLPVLISNCVQVQAFWLSPDTPGAASPVCRRAVSPAKAVGAAEAVRDPRNASGPWASHPPGPLGLRHGCRTHRGQGLRELFRLGSHRVKTSGGRDHVQVGLPQ